MNPSYEHSKPGFQLQLYWCNALKWHRSVLLLQQYFFFLKYTYLFPILTTRLGSSMIAGLSTNCWYVTACSKNSSVGGKSYICKACIYGCLGWADLNLLAPLGHIGFTFIARVLRFNCNMEANCSEILNLRRWWGFLCLLLGVFPFKIQPKAKAQGWNCEGGNLLLEKLCKFTSDSDDSMTQINHRIYEMF